MYVLHDSSGSITGVVTGDKAYGEHLSKFGHEWIYLTERDDSQIVNFDTMKSFVDIDKKAAGAAHPECLCEKSRLELSTDKIEIVADSTDAATISGIPSGSRVSIISDARIEFDGVVDDGQIELSAATPTTYTVHVTPAGARYIPTSIQVVAK